MTDVVDKATRSRMMAGIRNKSTGIELSVRKSLFAKGFRYRLNRKDLPGRPDIVLPRYQAAIFVHGCFWHGHDCALFRLPATNRQFWQIKIEGNRARDERIYEALAKIGWRIAVVWECALRTKNKVALGQVAGKLDRWLRGRTGRAEIRA